VGLVDLYDAGSERACIHHELHPLPRRLDGRVTQRIAQAEVVDDDMHDADRIAHSYLASGLLTTRTVKVTAAVPNRPVTRQHPVVGNVNAVA